MRSASRSPSAKSIAGAEDWTKSGKQAIFQEGYSYMGKAVREMDRMLKVLKKENKELRMALEESEPEYRMEKDSDSDEFEDWEDEPREQTRRVRIRSSTPVPVNRTTHRYLRFNASKES